MVHRHRHKWQNICHDRENRPLAWCEGCGSNKYMSVIQSVELHDLLKTCASLGEQEAIPGCHSFGAELRARARWVLEKRKKAPSAGGKHG